MKLPAAQEVLTQAVLEGHSESSAAGLRLERLSSESGAHHMEGERYRVHSGQQQLRHIPQDGRGRQLFLEQEVGQVRPRFHVLLGPSLAPQGYLGLSPLHVLLGCVGGRCREASLPLDGFPSSHPRFTSVPHQMQTSGPSLGRGGPRVPAPGGAASWASPWSTAWTQTQIPLPG